jgi:hypothetical protein
VGGLFELFSRFVVDRALALLRAPAALDVFFIDFFDPSPQSFDFSTELQSSDSNPQLSKAP